MLARLLLIGLSLLSFSVWAQPDTDNIVKPAVTAFMEKNQVPGAAVILYVNSKPYAYYFGYANRDKKTPVNQNTIFELGSITKIMTSLLLAQEVDAAKVQLDDSVTPYLTTLSPAFEDITLLNLATHTAGLPLNTPDAIKTEHDWNKYAETWRPPYSPDEKWIDSNIGMGLLGEAMEVVTHKNLDQLYRTRILLPLKMRPMGLVVPAQWKKAIAQGYDGQGSPVKPSPLGAFPSAYGMRASAQDMQHFLAAAIGLPGTPDRILYPIRMTQTAYVELPDWDQGLAWQIHDLSPDDIKDLLQDKQPDLLKPVKVREMIEKPLFDGNSLIDKTGTTQGFRAYIAVIPNKNTGIVILANKTSSDQSIVTTGRNILFKLNALL